MWLKFQVIPIYLAISCNYNGQKPRARDPCKSEQIISSGCPDVGPPFYLDNCELFLPLLSALLPVELQNS